MIQKGKIIDLAKARLQMAEKKKKNREKTISDFWGWILLESENVRALKIRLRTDKAFKKFFVEYLIRNRWRVYFESRAVLFNLLIDHLFCLIDFSENENKEICGKIELAIIIDGDNRTLIKKMKYYQIENGLVFENEK